MHRWWAGRDKREDGGGGREMCGSREAGAREAGVRHVLPICHLHEKNRGILRLGFRSTAPTI